ncbi:hypothetical protein BT63DRAFT_471807 [Microthyrium microscopicum]|uniref:tRNA-splicing endonuclease subunit Sen15 domain-containing protein n=1 Tax=Microthyrium microscopicum TaxID=703497 RepID=A0A6A6UAU5_9PEZI|nr:hypothetical protein BT63DRAFT_471807 [Microthyrium microscopicum]
MYAKFPVPLDGAEKVKDLEGREWDFKGTGAFWFEYVKDATGHKGLKLRRWRTYADGMPIVMEITKRGMATFDDVVKKVETFDDGIKLGIDISKPGPKQWLFFVLTLERDVDVVDFLSPQNPVTGKMRTTSVATPSAPSQLMQLLATRPDDSYHQLALQIQHNLEFEHRWTQLKIHTISPLTGQPLARPIVSGLPPRRVYVHPDEQIELLKQESQRKVQRAQTSGDRIPNEPIELSPELEWVLPMHLQEEWSLRRLATIFDAIPSEPPGPDGYEPGQPLQNKWRSTKHLLAAILSDDSTVVYYVAHDGIVKPRQN